MEKYPGEGKRVFRKCGLTIEFGYTVSRNVVSFEARGSGEEKRREEKRKEESNATTGRGGGDGGCSTYKRAVARGATRLPTRRPLCGGVVQQRQQKRQWTRCAKRKEERQKGGKNVHLIHSPTVPSFLPLLMIACTSDAHRVHCIGYDANNNNNNNARIYIYLYIYIYIYIRMSRNATCITYDI